MAQENPQKIENKLQKAKLEIYQNPEKAIRLATQVYRKAKNTAHKITALITLVNGYTATHQNKNALVFAHKALSVANASERPRQKIRVLGLLGEQYQLYHLNKISRNYLNRAETLINTSNLSDEMIALSKGNIFAVKGNSYKDQIDCGYAIENYNMAITAYRELSQRSSAQNNLALVYLEKGNCLLELERLKKAENNFKKALHIAKANGLNEYKQYANLGLAKIDYLTCNYRASLSYLSALKNTDKDTLQARMEQELYSLLKKNHLGLGNTEKYLSYQKKYRESSREIHQLENATFRQVLKFFRNYPSPKNHPFLTEKIILFSLLTLCLTVIIFEVIQRRKIRNSKNKYDVQG